ncbi:MAG: hypothetical protein J5912_08630, partial [Clostridia bacterium]|nr:hypothetical protein [Clostridia bacterium]
ADFRSDIRFRRAGEKTAVRHFAPPVFAIGCAVILPQNTRGPQRESAGINGNQRESTRKAEVDRLLHEAEPCREKTVAEAITRVI